MPVLWLVAQGFVGGPEAGQGGRFAVDQVVDQWRGDQVQALGEQATGGGEGGSGSGSA